MKPLHLILGGLLVAIAVLLANRIATGRSESNDSPGAAEIRTRERPGIAATSKQPTPPPGKTRDREHTPKSPPSKADALAREIERAFPDPAAGFVAQARHERLEDRGGERWTIRAFVTPEGFEALLKVTSHEGIHKVFDRIHAETGDDSFATTTATISVDTVTRENKDHNPEASPTPRDKAAYLLICELKVTRR